MNRLLPLARTLILALSLALSATQAWADSVEEINAKSLNALVFLRGYADGAEAFLKGSAGVLVFPDIVKLGFGVGGQYGEGVLLVDQQPVGYYAISGGDFGLELGESFKAEVIVFVSEDALQRFRDAHGWKVGVDGNIALARRGAGAGLDTGEGRDDVVGFIFSDKGLLSELDFEGSKITRLAR